MKSTLYRFDDGLYWIPDSSPPKAQHGTGPFDSHRAAFLWWCCQVEDTLTTEQKQLWAQVVLQLGDGADAALLMGILDRVVSGERREVILKMARPMVAWSMRALGDR